MNDNVVSLLDVRKNQFTQYQQEKLNNNNKVIRDVMPPILADIMLDALSRPAIWHHGLPTVCPSLSGTTLAVYSNRDSVRFTAGSNEYIDNYANVRLKSKFLVTLEDLSNTFTRGNAVDEVLSVVLNAAKSILFNPRTNEFNNIRSFIRNWPLPLTVLMMDEAVYLHEIVGMLRSMGFNVHSTYDGDLLKITTWTDLHRFKFELPIRVNLGTLDESLGKYPSEFGSIAIYIDNILTGKK